MSFHDYELDPPRSPAQYEVWHVTTRSSKIVLTFEAENGVVMRCDPRVRNLYLGKPIGDVLGKYRRDGAKVERFDIKETVPTKSPPPEPIVIRPTVTLTFDPVMEPLQAQFRREAFTEAWQRAEDGERGQVDVSAGGLRFVFEIGEGH